MPIAEAVFKPRMTCAVRQSSCLSVLHEWWTVFRLYPFEILALLLTCQQFSLHFNSCCSTAGGGTGAQLISKSLFLSRSGCIISPGYLCAWKSHCPCGINAVPSSLPWPAQSPLFAAGSALAWLLPGGFERMLISHCKGSDCMEQRIQALPLVELLFSLCLGTNSPGSM